MYENWPHPFVAKHQIQADIEYTRTLKNRERGIPAITPANVVSSAPSASSETETEDVTFEPGKPTGNLLGWQPCRKMPNEAVIALENCDVTEDEFRVCGPSNFYLNDNLMRMTSNILKGVRGLKIAPGPHLRKWGSAIQQALMTPEPRPGEFSRVRRYTNLHPFKVYTKHKLSDRLTTGALVCCFRVERARETDDWACYDWGDYKNVPAGWKSSRNQLIHQSQTSFITHLPLLPPPPTNSIMYYAPTLVHHFSELNHN